MEKELSIIEQQPNYTSAASSSIGRIAIGDFGNIDIATMLPYPIAPVLDKTRQIETWEDRHHAAYQRLSPELQGDAGRSVRHSRVQLVPRWLHNRYHKFYPDGIALPETDLEKFCFATLACAGYIPNKAVDVSQRKPKLVDIDAKGYRYFRKNGRIHPEVNINKTTGEDDYAKHRGIFFMKYVLENNIEGINPDLLKKFLSMNKERDSKKRAQLGWLIVGKAIENATDPIKPLYRKAQEMGMLDKSCPTGPQQVIKRAVRHHLPGCFDELETKVGLLVEAA